MKEESSAGVILFALSTKDKSQEISGNNNSENSDNLENKEILYLLLNYPRGYWDLAKGKIEKGETKKETALRELKEETGLEAKLLDDFEQILHYYFKSPEGELIYKTVTYFVGETTDFNVTISHEHIGYEWVNLPKALSQLTYTNAQQVVSRADHFIRHYLHLED